MPLHGNSIHRVEKQEAKKTRTPLTQIPKMPYGDLVALATK